MFKLIIIVLMIIVALYYIDIVARIIQDEKKGVVRYNGAKLVIPFAYWFFPYKEKKKKRNVKPKKQKNEAK